MWPPDVTFVSFILWSIAKVVQETPARKQLPNALWQQQQRARCVVVVVVVVVDDDGGGGGCGAAAAADVLAMSLEGQINPIW